MPIVNDNNMSDIKTQFLTYRHSLSPPQNFSLFKDARFNYSTIIRNETDNNQRPNYEG